MEQFHENGYFADPNTINDLAQYWEDQKNIDSLLGGATEGVDKRSQAEERQQHQLKASATHETHDAQQRHASSHDVQMHNLSTGLGTLVNYSSSSDDDN